MMFLFFQDSVIFLKMHFFYDFIFNLFSCFAKKIEKFITKILIKNVIIRYLISVQQQSKVVSDIAKQKQKICS
jgi:hypothetical protein